MSDREKLIELLDETFDKQYDRNLVITARNTADHLISNGVTLQKWIPVSERLPEKNTTVIAATDYGLVFQALYAYDGWDLWEGNEVNITHWMLLPEPPKECE